MTPPLSYLGFHAVFVLPAIAVLGSLAAWRSNAWLTREGVTGLAILLVLAVAYTTPWTNHMIPVGVWWYGEDVLVGRIWHTPIEEYLFFILQPILTAFVLFQFPVKTDRSLRIPASHRLVGALGGIAICVVGWTLLEGQTYYLGSLLFWAGPILAIQWSFGLTYLWRVRYPVSLAVALPTLYLWVIDRIAIEWGIWAISAVHTTGYEIAGLPIEEALFFLSTNVFVVQGIVLYVWLIDRIDELPPLEWHRRVGGN
ncbi:lycopene cyclase domain-containing protein [Natronobacterium gregoryi]|uniref:Lycopene cyclase domain protein n=2 Tax=Natronobacterium gregoryi TaxID=44930 RepID=L0AEL8_NATGS|nr:lycopene cyclase domain-containing protein [Natronobacterium gregoryi]AFZ71505.1 lycopene cyclase domain protein [Natronobacterium gregoryi SP2]ELY66720.1 lycopene cyclase domain-containing protein [Natronobacterium gregoryi SP2]PLK21279.1 lycopene cyclase domain-containing protein [Natronobacterium gregoryi SP2]SFI83177.1 lycopene cyclase domain-containing protein [Natronobacterium gregoryi]